MKAKDARKQLSGFVGEDLYRMACKLYASEIDKLVLFHAHEKTPTVVMVESAVKQIAEWFRRVYPDLTWGNAKTPENIIEWETGNAYVRHNVVDPRVTELGKRTRLEILKGTPMPMLEALREGDLDAVASMMVAQVARDAKKWSKIYEHQLEFVEKHGLTICPYGVKERFCEYQTTYSIVTPESLPTSMDDLVFTCSLDKCVKGQGE